MSDAAPNSDTTAAPRPSLRADSAARRNARYAQTFANIIAVLMRDPGFRNLRLSDLEWLVLPAIISGQWKLVQTREQKPGTKGPEGELVVPSAVALWASVSPEVDKRLMENLDKPLVLQSHEWLSGDILWLVVAAGDKRIVPRFLTQLADTEFKGKKVKARTNGPDGKVVVRTLRPQAREQA